MNTRLSDALYYYLGVGFTPVEAPWVVNREIMNITAPSGATLFPFLGGGFLVASGEQSFLQMIFDNRLAPGRWQCTTPCFRDDRPDEIHHNYFMKLELIDTLDVSRHSLADILQRSKSFFSRYVSCDVFRVELPSELDIPDAAFDIISSEGIELGSYGIRHHPLVGHWVYGTGCAEPRLTYVINKQGRNCDD